MTDLPHEKPQVLYSDFAQYKYTEIIQALIDNQPSIQATLTQARTLADFGSRLGNTATALCSFCANATQIHTVDFDTPIDRELKRQILSQGKRVIEHEQTITEFLQQAANNTIDIVTIGAVPQHLLDKHQGYQNLHRAVTPNGLVLEFFDTKLDIQAMIKAGFSLKYQDDWVGVAYRVWQKT